jgi:hypothetical protein
MLPLFFATLQFSPMFHAVTGGGFPMFSSWNDGIFYNIQIGKQVHLIVRATLLVPPT